MILSFALISVVYILGLACTKVSGSHAPFSGSPIVLVPGDGGSQFVAKLNKTKVVHYLCDKKTKEYFPLWLNLELLLPPFNLDCFVDNMRLVYNVTSRTTSNSPGVDVVIPGFGNTTSIEFLDPSQVAVSHYFYTIVDKATRWGYIRGKSIVGAPFDFRKAPNEMGKYFQNLTKLIEDAYRYNCQRKVTLVAHSSGNPILLYFLNNKSNVWKDKFIKAWVAIAAPWSGSMKIMVLFASGYNLGHWNIVANPLKLRKEQRSMPSSAFLIPTTPAWHPDEVLVETFKKNYTMKDYQQFFTDINFTTGYEMVQDTKDLIKGLSAPNVEVHNLHGINVPTPSKYIYSKGYFPDYQPTIINANGDGSVNLKSVRACLKWRTEQKQKVYSRSFNGAEHLQILKDLKIVEYIKKVVFN